MDIPQLKAFRAVAHRQSFSKAAQDLFTSQPAVSRQVSSLEAELGLPLFVRMGNHIALTDPGRQLLKYAEDILHTVEQAGRTIQDIQDLRQGTVTVVADSYLSQYFLPRFAGEFHRRYPSLQLRLLTAPQARLPELLALGQADLAFLCGQLEANMPLSLEKLCDEELCFVAPGPLSADIERNLAQYAPFLFPPELSSFGEDYKQLLPDSMVRDKAPIAMESLEGIRTSLLGGLGCSILPQNLIRLEVEKGYLHAMPTGLKCPVLLTYPKNARLANPVLLLMGVIRKSPK